MELKTRPGTLWRAAGAFLLLNIILATTLFGVAIIAPYLQQVVWLQVAAAILLVAIEFAITVSTITDPLQQWVKGEYYEKDPAP